MERPARHLDKPNGSLPAITRVCYPLYSGNATEKPKEGRFANQNCRANGQPSNKKPKEREAFNLTDYAARIPKKQDFQKPKTASTHDYSQLDSTKQRHRNPDDKPTEAGGKNMVWHDPETGETDYQELVATVEACGHRDPMTPEMLHARELLDALKNPHLVVLYLTMRKHQDTPGSYFPAMKTLMRETGLRNVGEVYQLIAQLSGMGLVEMYPRWRNDVGEISLAEIDEFPHRASNGFVVYDLDETDLKIMPMMQDLQWLVLAVNLDRFGKVGEVDE